MLGYVHLLPETRPALERRTVAGTALWVLEGDLDGGLLPRRRLRRWTRRLAECAVSHAALPPGREAEFAPIRPVLPDGLRLALLPRLLDCLAPAGDTALLLADRADSRTLCAARVLAERFRHLRLSVGPGQEALERQLLRQLELLHPGIFSLECLTVDGHEKRGQYVPSHIHMNVTYLLGARDRALRQKPDENSGVAWFTPREALEASTEPWMVQRVYSKLTQRAAAYMAR